MVRFALPRVGQTVAVLWIVSTILFVLMRLIPGDPVLIMLGDEFTPTPMPSSRLRVSNDHANPLHL
jgi:ABC-type dipeptide/oligopeptide/nickel transport system permease component